MVCENEQKQINVQIPWSMILIEAGGRPCDDVRLCQV